MPSPRSKDSVGHNHGREQFQASPAGVASALRMQVPETSPVPKAGEKGSATPVLSGVPSLQGLPGTGAGLPVDDPGRAPRIAAMDWVELEQAIQSCRACQLGDTRKNAVVGAGNQKGRWLFVGEAPGAEEDRLGEAFVGRAGKLLDAMLQAMGLSRTGQVYIANILKCRPPQNRDPLGLEVRTCIPFLQRQIALLQPRIIVALGRFAAQGLLQKDTPLNRLRGVPQRYQDIPVIVTYHPAYLLRNPLDKRRAWEDLRLALQVHLSLDDRSRTDSIASATE